MTIKNTPASPPQAIRIAAKLPQLDRAVLAPSSIELTVGREADGPDRTVMALVHIQLFLLVEIIHPHPRVAGAAGNEAALSAVQRNAGDLVGCFDAFDEAAGVEAVEEVGAVAGRDAEDAAAAAAVAFRGEGVELAAADDAFEVVFVDGRARAQVPPADLLVVGGGDEDVEVGAPDDGLDGAAVDARADFVAGRRVGRRADVAVDRSARAVGACGG